MDEQSKNTLTQEDFPDYDVIGVCPVYSLFQLLRTY